MTTCAWEKIYRPCLSLKEQVLVPCGYNGRILEIPTPLALPSSLCYTTLMSNLDSLLQFVHFTHLTHKVERVARIPGETRYANTVEHSYQLTLLAWYLIEKEKLPFDKDLVIRYALIHDLVETYAGDTYIYDVVQKETKEKREHDAQVRIASEFPEFEDLHTHIQKYEAKLDAESRFVYALDKLIDPLNIYLEEGKLWREKEVTLEALLTNKTEKVAIDPTVSKYFDELVNLLREKEKTLFTTK